MRRDRWMEYRPAWATHERMPNNMLKATRHVPAGYYPENEWARRGLMFAVGPYPEGARFGYYRFRIHEAGVDAEVGYRHTPYLRFRWPHLPKVKLTHDDLRAYMNEHLEVLEVLVPPEAADPRCLPRL